VRTADAGPLVERALSGDRGAIARLISLVEAGGDAAVASIARLFAHTGRAYTVGITGAPGSGKSTLTDRLIAGIRRGGETVAVLAVDPSSPFSGGAILGDRVRMQAHATDPGVFIRSMATRGHLGGLALATPQAARVLDAAGLPWILVETVGVGQVEVEVAGATDTTVVVVNPGWGDAVQANKAGLLEVADVFAVNKADRPGVDETVRDLAQMLELAGGHDWRPPVVETVATEDRGTDALWSAVAAHREFLGEHGRLAHRRRDRLAQEVRTIARERVTAGVEHAARTDAFAALVDEVAARAVDPYAAADRLLADAGR
jgi:LAO/AO transport system kinase